MDWKNLPHYFERIEYEIVYFIPLIFNSVLFLSKKSETNWLFYFEQNHLKSKVGIVIYNIIIFDDLDCIISNKVKFFLSS